MTTCYSYALVTLLCKAGTSRDRTTGTAPQGKGVNVAGMQRRYCGMVVLVSVLGSLEKLMQYSSLAKKTGMIPAVLKD